MPKYHKKPKGSDAHQHIAGEDWAQTEPWIQTLITDGRLIVVDGVAGIRRPDGPPYTILPTQWLVQDEVGGLAIMTDEQFSDLYDKDHLADEFLG